MVGDGLPQTPNSKYTLAHSSIKHDQTYQHVSTSFFDAWVFQQTSCYAICDLAFHTAD